MDVSDLIQDMYNVTDRRGTFEARALRQLYFRQKEEQATKYSPGREKKDYLDVIHTIPAFRPGEVYRTGHNLTHRKQGNFYTPNSHSRVRSAYAGQQNPFYKLRDQDDDEAYIN